MSDELRKREEESLGFGLFTDHFSLITVVNAGVAQW